MTPLTAPGDPRDRGSSLPELLVVMVLTAVIGTLLTGAIAQAHRTLRASDDDARGLGDVRVLAEVLTRDLRSARGVLGVPQVTTGLAATPSRLTLWVDRDADYVVDTVERVTWSAVPAADGVHQDVVRTTGDGGSRVVSRALVASVLFEYDAPAPYTASRTVGVNLVYDALGGGAAQRSVDFDVRLRNVQ